jgi:GT2 family glycosyltransferase
MAGIAVGVPTVGVEGLLDRCLTSVAAQAGITAKVILVQNGPGARSLCADWGARGVFVHRPDQNLGVAASWNFMSRWAWERAYAGIVLLNEDVELTHRDTLAAFAEAVETDPRQLYFLSGRGFSAICLTRVVWEEVGEFDEGFWPAYMEDCDYHWRAGLLDVPGRELDLPSEHVGSAVIKSDSQINGLVTQLFEPRHARYQAKWGGYPGREIYQVAWNGAEPWPSLFQLWQTMRQETGTGTTMS